MFSPVHCPIARPRRGYMRTGKSTVPEHKTRKRNEPENEGVPAMKLMKLRLATGLGLALFMATIMIAAAPVQAAVWNADAGAQSTGEGNQALAFLSREPWLHA